MRDSESKGFIVLEGLILHVTDMAVLVEVDGENHWIPKSMLLDEAVEADRHNVQEIEVKEWFCRKEEII